MTETIVTIAMGVIAVAALATIVSRNANTADVIQSAASGFSNSLAVAESPVSGSGVSIVTAYPSETDY